MPGSRDIEAIVADYEISASGSRIPPEVQVAVAGLEVDLAFEAAGMFSFVVHAGERDQEKFPLIDSDLFKPGSEIKIKMGYGSTLETLIVGEISSLCPEFEDNGAVVLRVSGYDRLYRLGLGRKTRSFRNMKDSDIAAQIAQDWRLTPDTEATDITHEYVFQNNLTDREFLAARARLLRYEVRVEDKTLVFHRAGDGGNPVVTMSYGETLMEFFPVYSTIEQTAKAEVSGWSVKDKKAVRGEAGPADVISKMSGTQTGCDVSNEIAGETRRAVRGENASTREEAEIMARASLNRAAAELITAEGRCVGNPDIRAGCVIELKGLGKRFSGRYYVTSCTHLIGSRGYQTRFESRRSGS